MLILTDIVTRERTHFCSDCLLYMYVIYLRIIRPNCTFLSTVTVLSYPESNLLRKSWYFSEMLLFKVILIKSMNHIIFFNLSETTSLNIFLQSVKLEKVNTKYLFFNLNKANFNLNDQCKSFICYFKFRFYRMKIEF